MSSQGNDGGGGGLNGRVRMWLANTTTVDQPSSSPTQNNKNHLKGDNHRPITTATLLTHSRHHHRGPTEAAEHHRHAAHRQGTLLPTTMPAGASSSRDNKPVVESMSTGGTGISFHADMAKHRRAPEPFILEGCKTAAHLASISQFTEKDGSARGGGGGDFGAEQSFGHPECERPERVERTWSHLIACGLPQLCKYQCGPRDAFRTLPPPPSNINNGNEDCEGGGRCCCCCGDGGILSSCNTTVSMCNNRRNQEANANTAMISSAPILSSSASALVFGRQDAIYEPLVPAKNKTLRLVHDRDHIDAVDGYSSSLVMTRMFRGDNTTNNTLPPSHSSTLVPPFPAAIPRPFSIDGGNDLYYNDTTAKAARLATQGVVQLALEVCKWDPIEIEWFKENKPNVLLDLQAAASSPSMALSQRSIQNGLAVVRPPGHHCSGTSPSGFCFYNNVSVAARAAQKAYPERIKRVLIVDWDVHHGNGTEEIFYDDPSVLFFSVHEHGSKAGHTVRMSRMVKSKLQAEEARRRKWQDALQKAHQEEEVSRKQREAAAVEVAAAAGRTTLTDAPIKQDGSGASVVPSGEVIGSKRVRSQEISAEDLLAAFFATTPSTPPATAPTASVVLGEAAPPSSVKAEMDSRDEVVAVPSSLPSVSNTEMHQQQQQLPITTKAEEQVAGDGDVVPPASGGRRGGRPRRRIDVVALEAQLEGMDDDPLNQLLVSAGVAVGPPTPVVVSGSSPPVGTSAHHNHAALQQHNEREDGEEEDNDDGGSETTTSSVGSGLSWMKSVLRGEGGAGGDDSSSNSDEDEEWSETLSSDQQQLLHDSQENPLRRCGNSCGVNDGSALQRAMNRKLRRVHCKLLEARGRTVRGDLRRRRRIARGCPTAGDTEVIASSAGRRRGFKIGSRSQFRQERIAFKGDETPDGSSFSDRVDVWTDGVWSGSEATWETPSSDDSHRISEDDVLSSCGEQEQEHHAAGMGKSIVRSQMGTKKERNQKRWRFGARSRMNRRKQNPFYPASGFLDRVGGSDMPSGRYHRRRHPLKQDDDDYGKRSSSTCSSNLSDLSESSRIHKAAGTTINAPWPTHHMGDLEYLYLLETVLLPLVRRAGGTGASPSSSPFFQPDLIIVSSGFDSCAEDILGSQALSPSGYYWMTHMLASIFTPTTSTTALSTHRPRPQRLVVALEGGYNLRNVALSSEMVLRALMEASEDGRCLEELERRRDAAERSVIRDIKQTEAKRRQIRIETRRLKRQAKEVRASIKAGKAIPSSSSSVVNGSDRMDNVLAAIDAEFTYRKQLYWDRAVASRQQQQHRGITSAVFCGSCPCCRQSLLAAKNRSLLGQCRRLAGKLHEAHKPYWGGRRRM